MYEHVHTQGGALVQVCFWSSGREWGHSGPGRPTHAQIFGALPGRGPKHCVRVWGGSSPAAPWKTPLRPKLCPEPSEAKREVSPFLGCQLQQFLRGDGSSRRAKPGFREAHLLPGLRARGGATPSGSARGRDEGGVATGGTGPEDRFCQEPKVKVFPSWDNAGGDVGAGRPQRDDLSGCLWRRIVKEEAETKKLPCSSPGVPVLARIEGGNTVEKVVFQGLPSVSRSHPGSIISHLNHCWTWCPHIQPPPVSSQLFREEKPSAKEEPHTGAS
ncbi:uncharacterized protein [Canis lupus baileyi]|uniref:uncharacterized protein n=1 Tax=Canis lupus baileyi TaxID=143281 RepID=UPI003B972E23